MAGWARIFGENGSVGYGAKDIFGRAAEFARHGPSYDFGIAGFQAGLDIYRRQHQDGSRDTAGFYLGAGRIHRDVRAAYGGKAGTTEMDGYSVGAYWTRKAATGWYVDAVLQGTRFDDISAKSVLDQSFSTNGWGFAASLEGGYSLAFGGGWTLEPQAQVIYQRVSIDGGADSFGLITYDDTNAVYGRIGARLARTWDAEDGRRVTAWARANLWQTFGSDVRTTFSNLAGLNPVSLRTDLGGAWGQVQVGLSGQITHNVSAFASGDVSFVLGDATGHGYGGRLGVKVVW